MKITERINDWERAIKQVAQIVDDHGAVLDEATDPALWLGWMKWPSLRIDAEKNTDLARRIVRELGGGWNWNRVEAANQINYEGTNGTMEFKIEYAEPKIDYLEITPLELVEVDTRPEVIQ